MKGEIQIEIQSERKIGETPVIGTQILDCNLPSELNFKSKNSDMNPEQSGYNTKDSLSTLKQFSVRGKGIFEIQPKYAENYLIKNAKKKFPVKAYNDDGGHGLKIIWQTVVGYAKKELIIQDGHVYVTQPTKTGNIRQNAYKLTNLIKIFIDTDQKSLRLVLKDQQHPNKRINRDYQTQVISDLMEQIILESNIIGIQIVQNDI